MLDERTVRVFRIPTVIARIDARVSADVVRIDVPGAASRTTEARKPRGVKSAWIVAVGSVIPRPLYVLIPGWRLARPGAMTAERRRVKLRKEPFGAGSVTTRGSVRAASVCSRGASASTESRRSVSNVSERRPGRGPQLAIRVPAAALRCSPRSFSFCTRPSPLVQAQRPGPRPSPRLRPLRDEPETRPASRNSLAASGVDRRSAQHLLRLASCLISQSVGRLALCSKRRDGANGDAGRPDPHPARAEPRPPRPPTAPRARERACPKALERIGGIQAQYAPSMYIGLWTRVEGFERKALDRALERRSVVQGTLMRPTIHLVSSATTGRSRRATREARRGGGCASGQTRTRASCAADRAEAAQAIADGAPQRRDRRGVGKRRGLSGSGWLDIVRVPPAGTGSAAGPTCSRRPRTGSAPRARPRRRARACSCAATCGGSARRPRRTSRTGRPRWRRSGRRSSASSCAASATSRARSCSTSPAAPLPDPETPAPPRFLPVWDATLLVHARRTGILPEQYRPRVFSVKNAAVREHVPRRRAGRRHVARGEGPHQAGAVRAARPRQREPSWRRRPTASRLSTLEVEA